MSMFSWFENKKPSVAFSFDNGSVRFISVIQDEKGIQVVKYGSEFLGPDIVGEHDDVLDEAKFVARLRYIVAQNNFRDVNIVVPDSRAIFFHTHIAKALPREMNDVIIDHLKTYCEVNNLLKLVDYICEYDIINETKFGYDAHVTLVPKLYMNHIGRLFRQSGIEIKHIETAHHAVARECLNIPNGSGYVALSFGNKKTYISVIHGEHLVSHDIVPVGLETLYKTVEKFLGVDHTDAEKIITRYGLLQIHPDNHLLGELHIALAPIVKSIDEQLIRIGQMPYKEFGHRFKTDMLIVYGESSHVKGLAGFLDEKTGLTTKELDVWAGHREDMAPIMNLPASETPTYAEALSLALLYLE